MEALLSQNSLSTTILARQEHSLQLTLLILTSEPLFSQDRLPAKLSISKLQLGISMLKVSNQMFLQFTLHQYHLPHKILQKPLLHFWATLRLLLQFKYLGHNLLQMALQLLAINYGWLKKRSHGLWSTTESIVLIS